jgi:hypothetical protein
VGQLALIAAHPADYERLVERVTKEGLPLEQLEREQFGTDHRAMGARLIEQWRLPSRFRSAVECGEASDGVGRLMHACCRLAAALGFRVSGPEQPFDRAQLAGLPAGALETPEELDGLFTDVATRINTIECSLMMF